MEFACLLMADFLLGFPYGSNVSSLLLLFIGLGSYCPLDRYWRYLGGCMVRLGGGFAIDLPSTRRCYSNKT